MKITINYKTLSYDSHIISSDKDIEKDLGQTIAENKDRRITVWFEEFIDSVKSVCNNDPFSIEINGCDTYERDFIESVLKKETKFIDNYIISFLKESEIKGKYKSIDEFIHYAENSTNELVKNAFKPNINDIKILRTTKVDIPVIASMSSGKSTLLNALIGQDFLAEDTGSTTATICDISLDNRFNTYVARAFNDGTEIKKSSSNIKEFLKEWNFKANLEEYSMLKLSIEGPRIRNFNTSNLSINFVDTPGPNSSKNYSHKEQTYSYLKDNINQPIILYLLDPEKMDSIDDDNTFKEISAVIKGNKQNLNRIVFVYTKIDREGLSEEKTFDDVLPKIKKFLKDKDIDNPKIFPLSAKYAKLALLEKSLTRTDRTELSAFRSNFKPDLKENYPGFELLKYAPLTQGQKDQLKENIKKSVMEADLVYSGLAALNFYIEDYVSHHHKKNQYKDLAGIADSMLDQIETSIDYEKDNLKKKSDKEQAEADQKAKKEKEVLNKKKDEVLIELNHIKPDTKFIEETRRKSDKTIDSLKDEALKKTNLKGHEVRMLMTSYNKELSNLEISLKTDLISNFREEVKRYQDRLKTKVKNKFEINFEDSSIKSRTFNAQLFNKVSMLNINSAAKYVKNETITKKEEVETLVVSETWWKRLFRIPDKKISTKTKKYSVSVFNKQNFINKEIIPVGNTFRNMISSFSKEFEESCLYCNESFQENIKNVIKESIDDVYEKYNKENVKNKEEKDRIINELDALSETLRKYI